MFKTNPHLAANFPNTYMEQFCKALHPDLDMGSVCVAWFRQAIQHCNNLFNNAKAPTAYFWTTVKKFIFPDIATGIMSQKVPISIHPTRLSMQDCQTLFLDIVSDYVQRAPRYAAESVANSMLWQVFYSLLGVMVLSFVFLATAYAYHKYGQPKKIINFLEEVFKPQNCMQLIAARSLRLAKTELRNLKIEPAARVDDILPVDGNEVLALKVKTKYEFLEATIAGSLYSKGKLHRPYDQHNKSKDFKLENINKAMQFLNNNCKKLHLLIMFEDDKEFAVEEQATRNDSPSIKSLSPAAKLYPRSLTSSPKQIANTRLDGGGTAPKISRLSMSYNSPRSSTPKQQKAPITTTTPRSGIPRNFQILSSSPKKSK